MLDNKPALSTGYDRGNLIDLNAKSQIAAVVDKSGVYHKRLFLEAWHSQRDQNAGNEHKDIPGAYKSLS